MKHHWLRVFASSVGGGGPTDADAIALITRVESASGDDQGLEAAVATAIDDLFIGIKADYGSLAPFAQILLPAGPRTISGVMEAYHGVAGTNVGFVTGDIDRGLGILSDGSKNLALNRNADTDPQNDRHVYARMTSDYTVLSTIKHLVGSVATSGGHTNVRHNGVPNLQFAASSGAIPITPVTPETAGGFGSARQDGTNLEVLRSGAFSTATQSSGTPATGPYRLFGSGSNGWATRVGVATTGAYIDLALLDARVTTYLNALAAAGI